ncbi:hypothetical protein H5410_020529 [Solanum commersonii]|uniref:Uncharacterized protein n=1 Tax=Solanum commersonii TaxID=4109 RepID=A0A9J5ZBH9_SOLCO|nr:hypothetical protein H5410_020529 [Solanum commersonii]
MAEARRPFIAFKLCGQAIFKWRRHGDKATPTRQLNWTFPVTPKSNQYIGEVHLLSCSKMMAIGMVDGKTCSPL